MGRRPTCLLCSALSLAWIGGVAGLAWLNWPHVPLDMSPLDPATVEALRAAILRHCAAYGIAALVPPAIAWLVARRQGRNRT